MNGFMGMVEKTLMPLSNKISSNHILQSISKGLMSLMPVMMVGAFAAILQGLPIDGYQAFLKSSNLYGLFQTLINISTNMLALYCSFSIAYAYIKTTAYDAFSGAIISLMCFFVITPMVVTGEGWAAVTNLPFDWLGSKGLFAAMIVAILTAMLYVFICKRNIVIKMPEGVPEFVSKSFVGIIPGIIIIVLFAVISYGISLTSYGTLHQVIYSLIQVPLSGIGTSIWAALLVQTLTGLCWFFGIHGIAVVSVMMPIWMAADIENMSLAAAGVANSELPNIITYNWVSAVGTMGGAGATIGLVIWMSFRSKSNQYKTLGKLALIPGCFNINEPIVFGLPCVLNPITAIPFIFLPPLMIGLAYVLVQMGILPISNGIGAPMGTPLIIQGIFNGGWRLALFQVACIFISLIVYYPFFKVIDKKAVEQEKGTTE